MKAYAVTRAVLISCALFLTLFPSSRRIFAQSVGADVGGGAGIFRPRNPETKKRASKASPTSRPSARTARSRVTDTGDRAEDLLEKGNQLRDARRYAEAEEAYQSVLKINPRDNRAAYGLGNVNTDQQRWEEAELAYRNAVRWNPSDVDGLVALSVVLVQPRTGASNAKRFTEAEDAARRAVQLQPKNAVAWDRLGVALQTRGSFGTETESAYRRAVELDPEFAVAYAHLARVLKRMGRTEEAAPLFDRAVGLAKDPPTLNLIAESLQAEQQWDRSIPVLKRALELDDHNPTSLLLMGRVLVIFKRYQEATSYLKTATEVSPRAFEPFNLLGRAYVAVDLFAEGEVAYERAAKFASAGDAKQLAGEFGFAGVGDGYMKVNQKANAERSYQRALQLDPGNKELEKKLSKARSR